jgi:hypothetical protein
MASATAAVLACALPFLSATAGEAVGVLRVTVRVVAPGDAAAACRVGTTGVVECAQGIAGGGGATPPSPIVVPPGLVAPVPPATSPVVTSPPAAEPVPSAPPPVEPIESVETRAVARVPAPAARPASLLPLTVTGRGQHLDANLASLPAAERVASSGRSGAEDGSRDVWSGFGPQGQVVASNWDSTAFRVSWQVVRWGPHEYIEKTVSW